MDRQDVPSRDAGDEVHVPDPQDAVDPILGSAVGAEDLDEDRMQTDPLEEGMDPPEGWSGADRYGTTAREQRDGETLDQSIWMDRPRTAQHSPVTTPGTYRDRVT